MALRDEVEARYSAQLLATLTLADRSGEDAQDTDVLDQACADTEDWFPIYVNEQYDSTIAQHVAVAVEVVIQLLRKRGATRRGIADAAWDRAVESMKDLAAIRARKRPRSVTSGTTQASIPEAGRRPVFDNEVFEETILNAPVETSDDS